MNFVNYIIFIILYLVLTYPLEHYGIKWHRWKYKNKKTMFLGMFNLAASVMFFAILMMFFDVYLPTTIFSLLLFGGIFVFTGAGLFFDHVFSRKFTLWAELNISPRDNAFLYLLRLIPGVVTILSHDQWLGIIIAIPCFIIAIGILKEKRQRTVSKSWEKEEMFTTGELYFHRLATKYEKKTGLNAIWQGRITKQFEEWCKKK